MNTISKKISRYRDYVDEQEQHLYYYYVGRKCVEENGYDQSFADLLSEHLEINDINSFHKGYLESS